jgi:hypothetical protein
LAFGVLHFAKKQMTTTGKERADKMTIKSQAKIIRVRLIVCYLPFPAFRGKPSI